MRMMKLALVTGLAGVVGSGSAYAITVKKRTEAPGLPPEIWQLVGGFCAIKDWHPLIADCQETKRRQMVIRHAAADGGVRRIDQHDVHDGPHEDGPHGVAGVSALELGSVQQFACSFSAEMATPAFIA